MTKLLNLYLCVISYIFIKFTTCGQTINQESPCPDIFEYSSSEYGLITVPSPGIGKHLLIELAFKIFSSLSKDNVGSLDLAKSRQETLQMILNEESHIQYIFRFPTVPNKPQIVHISYNGNIICSGVTDMSNPTGTISTVKLQSSLQSQRRIVHDNEMYGSFTGPQSPQWQPPPIEPHTPAPQPQPYDEQPNQPLPYQPQNNNRDENVCGVVDERFLDINPLAYGAKNIRRGSWPWLAAIFLSKSLSLNYICGGSLVSNRVVVTAAHCLFKGSTTIPTSKLHVFLGSFNLDVWAEPGRIERQVSFYKVHDDFMRNNIGSFDADIAIIMLNRVVDYTLNIRPICLWSGNNELQKVVGVNGTVVGWGLTEMGETSEPKLVEIPIVSQEQCLRQSVKSFKFITSNRTFCAGNQDGKTGPCNGDSGSAFAIQKYPNKWALRGIVSVSVTMKAEKTICDLSEFVIFSDASKFVDFVKENIKLSTEK